MSAQLYLGGLDVGTSGCKVTVFRADGPCAESHYAPYESHHTADTHTISGRDILRAVEQVLGAVTVPLAALGVTSFGESFALLDAHGEILADTMLYNDPRGAAEAQSFDPEPVMRTCCCAPAAMYSLPKLMWIRTHRPDLWARTRRVLLMGDLVIQMLTGECVTNYSAAARTMGFDVRRKCWDTALLAHAGIDPALLPSVAAPGTIVGTSHRCGLRGTKILTTLHDQGAAALGAGALSPGDAVDGSGSVECLTPIAADFPTDTALLRAGASFVPYVDGQAAGCAFSYTGGTALKWYRDRFAPTASYRELDDAAGDTPSRLLFLPHLAGAASPYMDPDARGLLYGLTLGTTPAQLYRAIMEGVAYEFRVNLDMMAAGGIRPARLLATGGGAKSRVWNQIKADITGLPLTVVDLPEVGAAGAAMLGAQALGLVSTLREAASLFSRTGETFAPNASRRAQYDDAYARYREMYAMARGLRANA